jgi:hypothetical protein
MLGSCGMQKLTNEYPEHSGVRGRDTETKEGEADRKL